jgi:hypothetical protein
MKVLTVLNNGMRAIDVKDFEAVVEGSGLILDTLVLSPDLFHNQ